MMLVLNPDPAKKASLDKVITGIQILLSNGKTLDIVTLLIEYTGHRFPFDFDQQHFYPGKKWLKIVTVQNPLPYTVWPD